MPERRHRPRFFVSYCVDDRRFVFDTCNILATYFGRENMFLFEEHANPQEDFLRRVLREIKEADGVILFVGKRFSEYQCIELAGTIAAEQRLWLVGLNGQHDLPTFVIKHAGARHILPDRYTDRVPPASAACARDLLRAIRDWWREHFEQPWVDWSNDRLLHGLPSVPQLFDYEKKIIDVYRTGPLDPTDDRARKLLDVGMPPQWPVNYRYPVWRENHLNPDVAGGFREGPDDRGGKVRAAALLALDSDRETAPLTFPEAGPSRRLAFPLQQCKTDLNVAILVSGGIAPGINAVIDALVQRHHAYRQADKAAGQEYELRVFGIRNGFLAISDGNLQPDLIELRPSETVKHVTRGGSILGTSRDDELLSLERRHSRLEQIAGALSRTDLMFDVLYVICGDGGMKAAHALWHVANNLPVRKGRPLSVVTVPKTMDNDILWVWQSFGFLSAVDESRKIVETLHTEVRSNPRLGIVQLFGSDSGFVVSHAVLASAAGYTTLALIPEIGFSALGVARYLKVALWRAAKRGREGDAGPVDRKFPHGLMVMAENAVPLDALECLGLVESPPQLAPIYARLHADLETAGNAFHLTDREADRIREFVGRLKEGRPAEGQTSDTIRRLGLRIMADVLPCLLRQEELVPPEQGLGWGEPDWARLRVVCSEPRHLVRALEPSTSDIITGQRLGLLAVDAAMAGYTDCMISQWLTEFTVVPLSLVVLGRKRVPPEGMFWKSVMSKTGQHADLMAPYPAGKASPNAG